jgi:arylsulfatase A-like enzyme
MERNNKIKGKLIMDRRSFLRSLTGVGAALSTMPFLSGCNTSSTKISKKPNILLILVDDMGWSDIGCFGGEVNTPNLNRLAKNGIRFTQFHNTAKCFPSRACLLTGLYAQQSKMNKSPGSFQNCITLGEMLRTVGYRTLWTGKHHGVDNPVTMGFDRYFGLRDGCCNYFNPGIQREGEGVPAHKTKFAPRTWCIDDKVYEPYTPKEKDFYTTDYFTKHALQYLDEYKEDGKPFFLYMAFTAPHDPLMAWPEDIKKYKGKFMAGYGSYRKARYQRQLDMGLLDGRYPLSEPTYADWEALSDEEKDKEDSRMAVYAAMIDRVDLNIGKLLDKIKERGELDNTLVLFASDNGCAGSSEGNFSGYNPTANQGEFGSMTRWTKIGHSWSNVSNTPYRLHKVDTHKGGSCTPLIAYWPNGIKGENRICHEPGHFIDIMPTLVEITGANYPTEFKNQQVVPMQGRSLVPVFQEKQLADRGALYWQYSRGKGVRFEKWRLVSDNNGPWNLYDMTVDKTETKNLIDEFPEIAKKLEAMYLDWIEKNA